MIDNVTTERLREIGMQGGCGLVAEKILERHPEGIPMLRYDSQGQNAVHAAIEIDGVLIHLGDDEGLGQVSITEFRRACAEDFDPDRIQVDSEELDLVVDEILGDDEEEYDMMGNHI